MPDPPHQDSPPRADESRRGVEELDIATGETIGTGPKTAEPGVADAGDADEPHVPEDARVDLPED